MFSSTLLTTVVSVDGCAAVTRSLWMHPGGVFSNATKEKYLSDTNIHFFAPTPGSCIVLMSHTVTLRNGSIPESHLVGHHNNATA